MNKPWEKYQTQTSATSINDGPWSKYSRPQAQKTKVDIDKPQDRSGQAALEGFGEGVSMGYLNNLQAITEKPVFAVLNAFTGENVEADDYLTARDSYNKRQEQLQKENPKSFAAGQIAGAAATAVPVAGAATGATAGARALQAARAGTLYGVAQNTSEKEGKIGGLDIPERIENAGMGAVSGLVSSVGADLLGAGVRAGANKISDVKNSVGQSFRKKAEQLAENATGATRVQAEKFSDDAGRYLLDEGIVSFGDTAENIANKASKKIGDAEKAIDSSLSALDAKGVKVSQDSIIQDIQGQIKTLESDPSKSDVVRKLKSIVDDIYSSGNSEITPQNAEQVKRGFNKMAKNWQDPEKGEAGKIAYRAYRDAVENTAQAADPALAAQFKQGKQVFGKLAPIESAAEKRAIQQNQNPIGGLLDVASVATGAAASDNPLEGGAAGIAAALARRNIAPKVGSSFAVTFDKISKQLLKNPQMASVAAKDPQTFRAAVFSLVEKAGERGSGGAEVLQRVADQGEKDVAALKGPEKWTAEGVQKINQSGANLSADQIQKLQKTTKGQNLLFQASSLKANSKAMNNLLGEIQQQLGKGEI